MHTDQALWQLLSAKTTSRLGFLSHPSHPASTSVPCRLPGCHAQVDRRNRTGRAPWFHDRSCAEEFRRRRRALDTAIGELAQPFLAGGLTTRESEVHQSALQWLLNIRATYPAPDEWKVAPDDLASDTGPSYQVAAAVRRCLAKPAPTAPCPSCETRAELQNLRMGPAKSKPDKRRDVVDTLDQIATLHERLLQLQPSPTAAEAAEHWREKAVEAAGLAEGMNAPHDPRIR